MECGSSPKTGRLKNQEESMFQFNFKGGKKPMFQLEGSQARFSYLEDNQTFCFYLGLPMIG